MNWVALKETIRCDLLDRNLKDPKIRLRALDKIERILIEFYPEYITDSENISAVDKNVFKRQIEAKKGGPLNSAEKSVINDIYRYCLGNTNNNVMPPISNLPQGEKYRIVGCPYCFTGLVLTEDMYDAETLHCPRCNNDFQSPVVKEKKIMRLNQISSSLLRRSRLNLMVFFGIVILFAIINWLMGCNNLQRTPTESEITTVTKEIAPKSNNSILTTNNTSNRANSENIKSHDSKKIIGVWADDFFDGIYHRIIESPKGVFTMEMGDKRSWIEEWSLERIIKNGVTIYKNSDYNYDDYYIINQDNNLEVFDNYGYIATYKRTNI